MPKKAAHCLRKEVRQNIKDEKRGKRGRDGDLSCEGSLKRREVSKYQETLSLADLGKIFKSRRAPNWEEKLKKPTGYMPKSNSQQKNTPEARIRHQQVGAEQGGTGCLA